VLVGSGWDQDAMNMSRYPTKEDLDVVVSDRPVILFRNCHHIAVINSKGLEALSIDEQTEAPIGGEIEKSNGKLTGILKENMLNTVDDYLVESDEERLQFYELGIKQCLEVGLTGVHTNDRDAFRYYKKLQDEGKLPIRVYLTVHADELDNPRTPKAGTKEGLLTCHRYVYNIVIEPPI
jgi:predicted amidohydrolase YtcJ